MTGVQTCALPISRHTNSPPSPPPLSATSAVCQAVDESVKDEFGHPRRVALKLMRNKDQFLREVQSRKKQFSDDHVVGILATYPEAGSDDLQAGAETVTLPEGPGGDPGADGPLSKPQVRSDPFSAARNAFFPP